MPGIFASIRVHNLLGLGLFLLVWIILCEGTHVVVILLRHEPLLGWAVGPLGITIMYLYEPSALYVWLNVLCPALISGSVLYIGLFTSLSPVTLPHQPFFEVCLIFCGLLLSSTADLVRALRDLRYPLWGEARLLHTIQKLRASWASIHFTAFGYSYVRDHFGANPTELLQIF